MSFIIRGLSSLLGSVLPCFYSYKTLQKPNRTKLTYWLEYWTVYGAYSALDWIANTFFISCFIPFYDLLSLFFIVFISVPQFGGASFMYKKVLAPFFRKKERKVDSVLGNVFSTIWRHAPAIVSNAVSAISSIMSNSPAMIEEVVEERQEEVQEDIEIDEVDESRMASHFVMEELEFSWLLPQDTHPDEPRISRRRSAIQDVPVPANWKPLPSRSLCRMTGNAKNELNSENSASSKEIKQENETRGRRARRAVNYDTEEEEEGIVVESEIKQEIEDPDYSIHEISTRRTSRSSQSQSVQQEVVSTTNVPNTTTKSRGASVRRGRPRKPSNVKNQ